ncbi:MaoC family dehydratase [Salarchaeum sp. JOR-1]|uniref:MaoC family dehydratase n=1 Tax=Salarchaeum sp. JOR-1 TaxID=2599399 RepID=UPI0011989A8A|nr:MaoC family dehydratase [Salarchaeum sp. JOR-1]QDX40979.1 MaoC family dehydratase [Salarchaeum sp. JOR-1]
MTYYEDFDVGDVEEFGSYTVSKEEIVEFAEQFDPQPFHVDEEAAAESPFGGLIASGWHTASLWMKLMVEHHYDDAASLGSPGVEEIQWTEPVRPGDTLSVRLEVAEKRPLESDPSRGLLTTDTAMFNQDDEVVMTMRGKAFYERRNPDA